MGRTLIVILVAAVGLAVPGLAAAGSDSDAVLREDEDGVVLVAAADDGGDTNTGNTGGSRDSLDTTAERSKSLDKSGDKTGGGQGADRSRSKDRSRDNTNDHSVGVTTNT